MVRSPAGETKGLPGIFEFDSIGEGYARARPPIHARIVARIAKRLGGTVRLALDVGCGAGLSTLPLLDVAGVAVGIDPSQAMLRWARRVAPECGFAAATAESLPLPGRSTDLITAAGSLNYVDLPLFFPEVQRVLSSEGKLAIYDFHQGRQFEDSPSLGEWFAAFEQRYPIAPAGAIVPEHLELDRYGLHLESNEAFEIAIERNMQSYLDYLLTESNVAQAVQKGDSFGEIREWCRRTLEPVFAGSPHDIVFPGYVAYVSACD